VNFLRFGFILAATNFALHIDLNQGAHNAFCIGLIERKAKGDIP